MHSTKIRPLEQKDIETFGKLHFPWSTEEKTVEIWKRYFEQQENKRRMSRIVEQQGQIVAYGSLLLHSEPYNLQNIQ